MITVTKLNHVEILLNPDLIEQVEETPDTVIMLTNGHGIRVRETMETIRQRIIEYQRTINSQSNSTLLKKGYQLHAQITEKREG